MAYNNVNGFLLVDCEIFRADEIKISFKTKN